MLGMAAAGSTASWAMQILTPKPHPSPCTSSPAPAAPHSASSALAWLLSSAASSATSLQQEGADRQGSRGACSERCCQLAEQDQHARSIRSHTTAHTVTPLYPLLPFPSSPPAYMFHATSHAGPDASSPGEAPPHPPASPVIRPRVALVRLIEAVGRPQQHIQRRIVSCVLCRQCTAQRLAPAAARLRLFCQRPPAHQPGEPVG